MAKFTFTSPEGKEYTSEGATQEEAWSNLGKQQPAAPATTGAAPPAETPSPEEIGGRGYQIARGAAQGAFLDPVEGLGQLAEQAIRLKYPEFRIPLPEGWRDYLREVRRNTEATGLGEASRLGGTIASFALAPEAAIFAAPRVAGATARAATGLERLASRAGQTVRTPAAMTPSQISQAARGARAVRQSARPGVRVENWEKALGRKLTKEERSKAILGEPPPSPTAPPPPAPAPRAPPGVAQRALTGATAAQLQPVEGARDEDYWTQKGIQAAAGGTLGALAGGATPRSHGGWGHMINIGGVAIPAYWLSHYLGISPAYMGAALAALAARSALRRAGQVGGQAAVRGVGAGAGETVGTYMQPEAQNAQTQQ